MSAADALTMAATDEIARLEAAQGAHRAPDARRVLNDERCSLIAARDSYERWLRHTTTAARMREAQAWRSSQGAAQLDSADRAALRETSDERLRARIAEAVRVREEWDRVPA